jgi:hypothetical protein
MKHLFATAALVALPLLSTAQEVPAPSPVSTVSQRIGLTDVTITYYRPSAKERKIFGDLVPYGEVWRTGANKATLLTTTGTLMLNGQKLPEGTYSMFTIPGEGAWQVIFNKNTELWGAYDRKAEEDVLTVKVSARPAAYTETFTIEFANLGQDKADILLRWEKQEAVLPVVADATDKAMANIQEALAKPDADYRAYARAASFCLDRGLEQKQALAWATKSVSLEKKYWNTFTLAKAQAEAGMYKEAADTGKEAVALAIAEKDGGAQKTYQAKVDEWTAKAAGK